MKLIAKHPQYITEGRTQSYRCVLQLLAELPHEDVNLFVCKNKNGIVYFDHVILNVEKSQIPADPHQPTFKTNTLDLYVPEKRYIDVIIEEILKDLRQQKQNFPEYLHLSGATI